MAAEPADLYVEVEESGHDHGDAASRACVPVSSPDDWELPPRPVLRNVFRRLPRNPDFDGATFLSKPWLALPCDGARVIAEPQRLMPALLLPEEMALDPASRCFLSLADGRFHDIAFPHARGARCVGSTRGWLVMVRKGPEGVAGAAGTATIHIVHPLLPHLEFRLPDEFSLFEIQVAAPEERFLLRLTPSEKARLRAGLPVETGAELLQRVFKTVEGLHPPEPYITDVTLSCSPAGSDDDDCVALCVYRDGRCLAIARPGDASWTRVEVGWEYMLPHEYRRKVVSVVHHKGSFYAACYDGMVLRVSIQPPGSASPPRVEKFADAPRRESIWCARWWLAVDTTSTGGGALVLVATERCWWTREIYMCAFRWDDELRFWRRPKDFGGRSLFVGRGTAFVADARHLPWCAGNCIYFTDDERVYTGEDVPVRCCDVRRRKLYSVHNTGPKVAMAPPVWVMPFHE
uniref:KIB1-4 beta-propeller domain-containing protein n=1 Tax=Oryza punctata TaxID=4537 RepID=A0A0E0LHW5_ORYPU